MPRGLLGKNIRVQITMNEDSMSGRGVEDEGSLALRRHSSRQPVGDLWVRIVTRTCPLWPESDSERIFLSRSPDSELELEQMRVPPADVRCLLRA